MTVDEIKWLMNAGLTVPEIMELSQAPAAVAQAPATVAQAPAAVAQAPATTAQAPTADPEPTMKDVLAELNKMANMLAMGNIRRDIQPIVPDTTTILNGMFAKPEVK